MNAFQWMTIPVLLAGALWSLWQSVVRRRRRMVLVALLLVIAAVCVAHPMLLQRLATALGIGRGTDLVGYFSALAVIGAYLLTLYGDRKLRREITELTRQLALQELGRGSSAGPQAGISARPPPGAG